MCVCVCVLQYTQRKHKKESIHLTTKSDTFRSLRVTHFFRCVYREVVSFFSRLDKIKPNFNDRRRNEK